MASADRCADDTVGVATVPPSKTAAKYNQAPANPLRVEPKVSEEK